MQTERWKCIYYSSNYVSSLFLIFSLILILISFSSCDSNSESEANADGDVEGTAIKIEPSEANNCEYTIPSFPDGCTSCHGMPPTKNSHMPNPHCHRCHGYVVDEKLAFVDEKLHKNGTVEVAVGCSSCHGWNKGVSPPQNLKAECGKGSLGVGAHEQMRRTKIIAHRVGCPNCHVVPTANDSPGHLDGDNKAEVVFAKLATAHGAKPTWDGNNCSNVYCHGTTLTGGTLKNPSWYDTSGKPGECGACHRLTDPEGNKDADCHSCHSQSVDKDQKILPFGKHINGILEIDGQ